MVAQFCDISQFQGQIDFTAYAAWARQWDKKARIAIKATEGIGFVDPSFAVNRARALVAGIDCIIHYHYARPDLNDAIAEANFMHSVVGDIRPQDLIILDFEENVPQATAEWAYEWLAQQELNYGKLPGIYASSAYIQENLQLNSLSRYPLWLAQWNYSPDERPPVPAPWTSYEFVQYTDRATNIPGITGAVDANIFLGGNTPMLMQVPVGWTDDGTTLTAPNGVPVVLGFRDYILNPANNWDANNWPLDVEYAANPVEQSNPSLGAGTAQDFRWKRLEYTAQNGVFEGWLGKELMWYQQQNATLKDLLASSNLGQIGTLTKQISDDVALIMKLVQLH